VPRPTKCNVPAAALKWSPERAGVEFGLTHVTMRKALAKNSAKPDSDGLYTTKQITDAVFGGLAEEKLATQRQLTKKYELENAITEASVLHRKSLEAGFAALADALKSAVKTSNLDRASQDTFLKNLAS
jgi:hypothetical protein